MAGQIDLRHHHDVLLGGIGDDLTDLILGIIAAIFGPIVFDPPGSDLIQLREPFAFDPEALIVAKMPVEPVHLEFGHPVQ